MLLISPKAQNLGSDESAMAARSVHSHLSTVPYKTR